MDATADNKFQPTCKKAFAKVTFADTLEPFSIAKRGKRAVVVLAAAALSLALFPIAWQLHTEYQMHQLRTRLALLKESQQAILNITRQFREDLEQVVKVFNSTNQQGELEALASLEKRLADSIEGNTEGKVNSHFLSFLTSELDVARTTRVKYLQPIGLTYDPSNDKLFLLFPRQDFLCKNCFPHF